MSYKNQLYPWCIIRPLSKVQMRIVGRFRRRVDAEGHLRILKQLIPNVPFEIMFDITPEDEDLTPPAPLPCVSEAARSAGRGEADSNSPLSNKAAPLPSPRRGGLGRGGEGLGERSTQE
jgi:hypothetical protein